MKAVEYSVRARSGLALLAAIGLIGLLVGIGLVATALILSAMKKEEIHEKTGRPATAKTILNATY